MKKSYLVITSIIFLIFLIFRFEVVYSGTTFGSKKVITSSANGAYSVYATDLDGDNDIDVLSASRWDDKIAWYENLAGGTFGSQQIITVSADGAISVYATDIDGDSDLDMLSASWGDDKIAGMRILAEAHSEPKKLSLLQQIMHILYMQLT